MRAKILNYTSNSIASVIKTRTKILNYLSQSTLRLNLGIPNFPLGDKVVYIASIIRNVIATYTTKAIELTRVNRKVNAERPSRVIKIKDDRKN